MICNLTTAPSSYYIVSVSFTHVSCSNRLHDFAVTPEKLCQAEFIELLDTVHENNNLNRLVVDEVGRRGHMFDIDNID